MSLFGICNLRAQNTEEVIDPFLAAQGHTAVFSRHPTKEAFIRWCQRPTTRYLFLSGYEGENPVMRVTTENPPIKMHALIADYDCDGSSIDLAVVEDNAGAMMPTYACRTYSGGVRLIWAFEAPVFNYGAEVQREFVKTLERELNLRALLPGLDSAALLDPMKYYAVGERWERIHLVTGLTSAILTGWMEQASRAARWSDLGIEIPITMVADEVARRFPGRWAGEFALGSRGPRFWDAAADNPTAAIVRESGMQCFTGPRPFVPWRDILGRDFVSRWQADRLGSAIEAVWFDRRNYWRKTAQESWLPMQRPDCQLFLERHHDLDKKEREVDDALLMIQDTKVIRAAIPLVHRPGGIHMIGGEPVLNISAVKAMAPVAEEGLAWGQGFEWTSGLLERLFDGDTDDAPLNYFLAWLRHFYLGISELAPRPGQVLFISGAVEQGKTLLGTGIISMIAGGHADGSNFLMGNTDFNRGIMEAGVVTVDDTSATIDPRKHAYFSSMVKKFAANPTFPYHAKFCDSFDIPWSGRLIVTCNDDPESMRILPDVESSLLDKVMFFRTTQIEQRFPSRREITQTLRRELPWMCRWLLENELPDHESSSRFGVHCYHHPAMLEEARVSSRGMSARELVEEFRRSFFTGTNSPVWEGTVSQLLAWMHADPGLSRLAQAYTVVGLGRQLGQLADNHDEGIEWHLSNGSRIWHILRHRQGEHVTTGTSFGGAQ